MAIKSRSLHIALGTTALLACSGLSAQAEAQYRDRDRDGDRDAPRDLRLYGGVGIGFGGELEIDGAGPLDLKSDLTTSIGGQFGVDAVVLSLLALGGEVRIVGWNTEVADNAGADRSKLIDVDFKPRLRFPLVNDRLEVYGALPIGLTIPLLADDIGGDANEGLDGTVGWNLGVGGGMTFFVTPRFGLNVEPMYVMRWFGVEGQGGGDADVTMKQFTLFANAVIAI